MEMGPPRIFVAVIRCHTLSNNSSTWPVHLRGAQSGMVTPAGSPVLTAQSPRGLLMERVGDHGKCLRGNGRTFTILYPFATGFPMSDPFCNDFRVDLLLVSHVFVDLFWAWLSAKSWTYVAYAHWYCRTTAFDFDHEATQRFYKLVLRRIETLRHCWKCTRVVMHCTKKSYQAEKNVHVVFQEEKHTGWFMKPALKWIVQSSWFGLSYMCVSCSSCLDTTLVSRGSYLVITYE